MLGVALNNRSMWQPIKDKHHKPFACLETKIEKSHPLPSICLSLKVSGYDCGMALISEQKNQKTGHI